MEFLTIGINHRKAPISLRERFAFEPDDAYEFLGRLKGSSIINEALYLATCNRFEIYAVTDGERSVGGKLRHELCVEAGVDPSSSADFWYEKTGPDAMRHLFRVASSLDAMVVGEAQILGQIKEAYSRAREQGTTGPFIDRAMLKAIGVAKKIRTETGIGKGQVSIASVAVDLAARHLEDLSNLTVLVVGAGEMGALVVRQLKKYGTGRILVANRTFEKAVLIAEHTGGEAIGWDDLSSAMRRADIIVSSTGANRPIIDEQMIAGAAKSRSRPMVIIDLGTPRDVKPEVSEIRNVHLFNIDDLSHIAKENSERRAMEAQKAEAMVSEESDKFFLELSKPEFLTTIAMLGRKLEALGAQEAEKTLAKLSGLDDRQKKIIEAGTQSIVAKILHDAARELKDGGSDDLERIILADTLCRLFRLNEE